MIQRLKDFLNSSFLWLLFLVGCIAFLFRKEKHLEDQLREQKFDDSLKETKNEQTQLDSTAADDLSKYNQLLGEYNADLQRSSGGVREGSSGSKETDRDPGSKN